MSLPQRRKRAGAGEVGVGPGVLLHGFNTRVYSCMARKKWQEWNRNRILSMHNFAVTINQLLQAIENVFLVCVDCTV